MGQKKKKVKSNDRTSESRATDARRETSEQLAPLETASTANAVSKSEASSRTPRGSDWFGGSWRAKASPVAQIARDPVSATGETSKAKALANKRPSHGDQSRNPLMRQGEKPSSKSVPVAAEASRIHVNAGDNAKAQVDSAVSGSVDGTSAVDEEPVKATTDESAVSEASKPTPNSTWLGWWSRPDGYASSGHNIPVSNKAREDNASNRALPSVDLTESTVVATTESNHKDALITKQEGAAQEMTGTVSAVATLPRSWFSLWSASQSEQQNRPADHDATVPGTDGGANEINSPPKADATSTVTQEHVQSPTATGWAFWSTENSKPNAIKPGTTQKVQGEIAVADTPSQSHPEAAQFNEKSSADIQKSVNKSRHKSKDSTSSLTVLIDAAANVLPDQTKPKSDAAKLAAATKTLKDKSKGPPNHILPMFASTYPPAYSQSYFAKIGDYLATSLRLKDTAHVTPDHICVAPTLPIIKNAIAIGVHGFFPAPIIQKVLGQPTGTSIRFANYAADAIRWWSNLHQPDTACHVEQIALEGEGLIADRVDTLWKLLLNWLSHLRKADLVLVACHSQGVPVSVMLVAKLVQLGCLSPNVRIGICAMAGVNLGPFADFKSKFFAGSAAELFDFADPHSAVSTEYAASLEVILRHGVRTTYIGSLDDQLVSLESSLFINLSHPYVQRAVFCDGRYHAADFITHLVAFALKLRNLGISDHGLIRELSAPLAGSLYSGEGHSRIYDDDQVYRLALDFTLNTTDIDPRTIVKTSGAVETQMSAEDAVARRKSTSGLPSTTSLANTIRRGNSALAQPGIPPRIAMYSSPASAANANPYYLPWAMRGILEEPVVKRDMQDETADLLRLFDEWKPVTKTLKDLRFRLEVVKSMM